MGGGFFKQTWIPITQKCFVLSLVEIGSGKEHFLKFCQCVFAIL